MTSEDGEAISLWQETIEALAEHDKTWEDVDYIGIGRAKQMPRDIFENYAKAFFYRPWMYGTHSINLDLQLYGEDFILIREEYDGSEGWKFCRTKPNRSAEFVGDLKEIQDSFWWRNK